MKSFVSKPVEISKAPGNRQTRVLNAARVGSGALVFVDSHDESFDRYDADPSSPDEAPDAIGRSRRPLLGAQPNGTLSR